MWGWSRWTAGKAALRDGLTRLPNHTAFASDATTALVHARPGSVAVVLFDVYGLSDVNVSCGHRAGDEVICLAARELGSVAARSAPVYRTSGNQFAMLLVRENGTGLMSLLRSIHPVAALLRACGHSHEVRFQHAYASCEPGEGFESLIQRAEVRLRLSKDGPQRPSRPTSLELPMPEATVTAPVLELVHSTEP